MTPESLIRPARAEDEEAVADLAVVNEMFAADELDEFLAMFRGAVTGDLPGHRWLVATRPSDDVVGAAYVAPEPFADRVWNLYFLAVLPGDHGRGTGTALVAHVEDSLREAGESTARVLVVETSSTGQYDATRSFYLARGFVEEARIREYYGPGDDKVVFWKQLAARAG